MGTETSTTTSEGGAPVPGEDLDKLSLPNLEGRANLRQQASEALRSLLITGQMRPGIVYSAPRLAAEFGISATPVREAMLDLVNEGMVTVVRNKGFRVTEVDDQDLDALAELRGLIEIPVMGMVAGACDARMAPDVEALRPLALRMTKAAADGDLLTFIEVDNEFHGRFLALHGNPHVVAVVQDMRRRSRLFGLGVLAEAGVLAQMSQEHEEMVDAALARDVDRMEDLMTRHMGHVRTAWAGR